MVGNEKSNTPPFAVKSQNKVSAAGLIRETPLNFRGRLNAVVVTALCWSSTEKIDVRVETTRIGEVKEERG